jgi:hypothetical protein
MIMMFFAYSVAGDAFLLGVYLFGKLGSGQIKLYAG